MRKEHIREQLFELDVRALQGSARKTDIVRPARNHERFCTADREYICAAWVRHEPAESIANHIGRTVGSVRQEVLKLQRRGQIGPRDANKTKLLRRLGKFGANPATTSEELKTIIAAQQNAAAESRRAKREATLRFHDEVIQEMRKKISQGVPRNVAIIEARGLGVTLNGIGSAFSLTRQRVSLICKSKPSKK